MLCSAGDHRLKVHPAHVLPGPQWLDHQARARSLGMQYFQKRLGEPPGAEERVSYAEGVADAEEALALVGTRRADRAIASAFFGDPHRLQRDVLGDAVRRAHFGIGKRALRLVRKCGRACVHGLDLQRDVFYGFEAAVVDIEIVDFDAL